MCTLNAQFGVTRDLKTSFLCNGTLEIDRVGVERKSINGEYKPPKKIRKFYSFLLPKEYEIKFENLVVTLNVIRDLILCLSY